MQQQHNITYPFTYIFGFFTDRFRINDRVIGDRCKQFFFIITIERRLTNCKIISHQLTLCFFLSHMIFETHATCHLEQL